MAPTLYMVPPSPSARAVLITAKAIGLDLQLKVVDMMNGEHKTPEYLKMNPQHTVPTFVDDDGFTFWDSHAISAYLVSKYAKNDDLYPKDLKKKAIVDQRLHFESGVLFPHLLVIGANFPLEQSNIDKMNEIYGFLEAFLQGREWFAGDFLSIADYQFLASVSTVNLAVPIDGTKYPKLEAWLKKVEALPEAEENKAGLEIIQNMFQSRMK